MTICRVCHFSFLEIDETRRRHSFFWFACKGCVKKARTKSRWHKRRKNATGTFSPTDWLITLLEYEFRCAECGEREPHLTLDHKKSLGEGGENNYDNMQPLCEGCHVHKAKIENMVRANNRMTCHTVEHNGEYSHETGYLDETLLGGRKRIFHRLEIPADIQAKIPSP